MEMWLQLLIIFSDSLKSKLLMGELKGCHEMSGDSNAHNRS